MLPDADRAVAQTGVGAALRVKGQHIAGAAAVVFVVLLLHRVADVVVKDGAGNHTARLDQIVSNNFELIVQHRGILRRVDRFIGVVGRDEVRVLLQHEQNCLADLRETGRHKGHFCLLAAEAGRRMVGFERLVKAAVSGSIHTVGIVQRLVAVDADIEREERRIAPDERLNLRLEIVLSVGADADTRPAGQFAPGLHTALEEVFANIPDQLRFQKRLPADEIKDDRFSGAVDERAGLIVQPHLNEHIHDALARVKAHNLVALVMLVAVVTAEVAAVCDLKCNLAHQRSVLHIRVQAVDIIVVVRQSRKLPHG